MRRLSQVYRGLRAAFVEIPEAGLKNCRPFPWAILQGFVFGPRLLYLSLIHISMNDLAVTILVGIVAAFMVFALIRYAMLFFQLLKATPKK